MDKEQAEQVKQQLLGQINNFPEDKREAIKQKIMSLDGAELEDFLVKNGLVQGAEGQQSGGAQDGQNVFAAIVEGKIPSYKIDENKDNIAILEINPISKGHVLVVPREQVPVVNVPSNAFSLAKKLAKKIKSKFKPVDIKISSNVIMDYALVEVIPFYKDTKGERKKASEAELKKLQEILKVKPRAKVVRKQKKVRSLVKLRAKIP